VNENGERRLNPNQLRPTDLLRDFQVEPAQVVSPMPDAGRSSGSRALRLSPGSCYPPLPSSKELVRVVGSCSLNTRGSPGVAPGSHLLSENVQRTSTSRSLLRHPAFVNSDSAGHGTIRFHQRDVACRRAKVASIVAGIYPQVQANTWSFQYVLPEERTDYRRALGDVKS